MVDDVFKTEEKIKSLTKLIQTGKGSCLAAECVLKHYLVPAKKMLRPLLDLTAVKSIKCSGTNYSLKLNAFFG